MMALLVIPDMRLLMMAAMILFLWAWWRMPRPHGTVFRLAGLLGLLALLTELTGYFTLKYNMNNSVFYNGYILAEAMLVLCMAGVIFPRRRFFVVLIGAMVLASFVFFHLRNEQYWTVNMEAMLVNCLLLSGVVFAVLWRLAQNPERHIASDPVFWLFLGLLVYFVGIIPVIGGYKLVRAQVRSIGMELHYIVPGLAMLRYLIGAWGCRVAQVDGR